MPGFPTPDSREPRLTVAPVPGNVRHARAVPAYLGLPSTLSTVAGIGTVVGILGIISSLTLLAVAGGLISVSASTAGRVKQFAGPALPVSRADQPAMISVPSAPVGPGPRGLAEADRDAVVSLLQRRVALSPAQTQQLHVLLREAGMQIFPRPVPVDDAAMASALLDSGTMTAHTDPPPVFFTTAGGRSEIYEDRAVFHPADGETVRTNARPHLNASDHPILRMEDIDALINLIRQTSGSQLKPAQAESLRKLLAAPDQQLIAFNGPPESPTIGISGAGAQPGGYLLVGFAGGSLLLSPGGEPLFSGDAMPGVSVGACISMMIMALAGLGLAFWLVMLSRRLAGQKLVTPRLHRRWAIAKFVTSVTAGVSFGWMIASFLSSRPGTTAATTLGIVAGVVLGAAGCVFPAMIVLLFRKRSAKLYFDGVM